MLRIASPVDAVAADHEHDGFWRVEHVFTAYWTIAVSGAFNAAVSVPDSNGHANAARLHSSRQPWYQW